MKVFKKITFRSPINVERSMLPTLERVADDVESEMEFRTNAVTGDQLQQQGWGIIEWNIEELDEIESIGIWWDNRVVTDYDGVFSLPHQASKMLKDMGLDVSEVADDGFEEWLAEQEVL